MSKREFTQEELAWLEANYHTMTLRACAQYLQISKDLVRKTAQRLGLNIGKKKPVADSKIAPNVTYESANFCIDCAMYRVGGICTESGRLTGALHRKNCFTKKSD